jgi:murein DD-endopeptidase MepM/ murein hydrolase activator NlpD
VIRALVVISLVVALAVPELAQASSNGGVAAFSVVASPKPAKRKKRKRKRPPPAASSHRIPVAGAFSWPGPDGMFGAPRAGHVHQGVDLMAAEGTPAIAPYAGTVSVVDYQAKAAGYYVVLHSADHDYVFMHLAAGSTRVSEGQKLATGARIGDVGQTGDAEGPHLHFEVWNGPWQQGGTAIDPLPLLKSWR